MSIAAIAPPLARDEIERFLKMVYDSIEAQVAVAHVGNDVHALAAYAARSGYAFTGDELGGYIAAQLDSRLDAAQKGARAAAFEREAVAPALVPAPRQAQVVTRDAARGFTLERGEVLAGDVVIVAGSAAFGAIAARVRTAIAAAFCGDDPTRHPASAQAQAYHARMQQVDRDLAEDLAMPRMLADFVRSIGWSPQGVGYFGPFVRVNLPPVREGAEGYFSKVQVRVTSRHAASDGGPALLNGHRDTWFGAPFHQVNFWAPLFAYPRGSGIVLMPSAFNRALRNNTAGFDVWRAELGLAVGPMCLEPVDAARRMAAEVGVGEFAAFSANHFHGTGANPGPAARISMELRMVCDDDRRDGVRAPNVDFHGVGELTSFRRLPA
jgi:hypothetical protein